MPDRQAKASETFPSENLLQPHRGIGTEGKRLACSLSCRWEQRKRSRGAGILLSPSQAHHCPQHLSEGHGDTSEPSQISEIHHGYVALEMAEGSTGKHFNL